MNLYAYVGGDPVNAVDPWGLQALPNCRAGDYVKACWVYVYGRSGPRTGGVINAQEDAGGTFYDRWSQRWRPGAGTSGYCEVCMTDEYRAQQAQEAEFDRRYGGYAIEAVAAPVAVPVLGEATIGAAAWSWRGGELVQIVSHSVRFRRLANKNLRMISQSWRINFTGSWRASNPYARLPHYHRRGPGGLGAHRPWEGGP